MYHCKLQFYLVGPACGVFDTVREMPPLAAFSHSFSHSDAPEEAAVRGADVIFVNLGRDGTVALLEPVLACKKPTADVIVLAGEAAAEALLPYLPQLSDVWPADMEEQQARFRFLRWQQGQKRDKDLWQTSQYLEAVINSSPDMIWFKNADGLHEKVNDAFCQIVNKPKAVVEGKDHCFIWDVGPADAEVCAETDRAVMNSGRTCTAEENVKSGEEMKLFITYKSPLYDLDGSVMGTVGVGVDVTQERAYERSLLQRNKALEAIFTTLDCGILNHSLDGSKIRYINQTALDLLGYRSLEELMKTGFEMVAPSVLDEDKAVLRSAIQSLTEVGESASVEYRVLHPTGEVLHIMGNIKLLEENGERYYQRFLLDVTRQKLQQREQERRQAALIQALSIDYSLVCAFDSNGVGQALRVDEEKNRLTGGAFEGTFTLEGCMQKYIDSLVYSEDQEDLRRALAPDILTQKLRENPLYDLRYRTQRADGVHYYEMKIVYVDAPEGGQMVLGLRSVDDSTRREMEQRHLLEDALAQASQASQAKSAFLSNMSHDLRTPMNAIIGFTTLALSHIGRREQVEDYLNKIMASGKHMLSLVNDVLEMSRIESGKTQLEEAPCRLSQVISDLGTMMQADAGAKNLSIHINADGIRTDAVLCDQLRLNQVLINIFSNAVKYTNPGGRVELTVTERSDPMPGYRGYEFRVKDTGIGMSPEFLSCIFDPFEREKTSTTSGIIGTGLGMTITKNLVDMMGGTIRIESELGVGTEVILYLALRPDPDAASLCDGPQGQAPADQAQAGPAHQSHGGERILLVEDNLLNQEIAVAILEDAGFSVEVAENGQVAVDLLTASKPGDFALVLMDIQMPVMNGYDATRAIRALPDKALAHIPILAMSANAFEEDRQKALHSGMNGHISKPIDVEKLLQVLEEYLPGQGE